MADVEDTPGTGRSRTLIGVVSGLALVYGVLFGVGHLLLGKPGSAAVGAVAAILGAFGVAHALRPLLKAPVRDR